jgi:hypothetical protein
MNHHHLRIVAALAAILVPAGSLQAANVLFVDTAATVHASWKELIESRGHTYTRLDTATADNMGCIDDLTLEQTTP